MGRPTGDACVICAHSVRWGPWGLFPAGLVPASPAAPRRGGAAIARCCAAAFPDARAGRRAHESRMNHKWILVCGARARRPVAGPRIGPGGPRTGPEATPERGERRTTDDAPRPRSDGRRADVGQAVVLNPWAVWAMTPMDADTVMGRASELPVARWIAPLEHGFLVTAARLAPLPAALPAARVRRAAQAAQDTPGLSDLRYAPPDRRPLQDTRLPRRTAARHPRYRASICRQV